MKLYGVILGLFISITSMHMIVDARCAGNDVGCCYGCTNCPEGSYKNSTGSWADCSQCTYDGKTLTCNCYDSCSDDAQQSKVSKSGCKKYGFKGQDLVCE